MRILGIAHLFDYLIVLAVAALSTYLLVYPVRKIAVRIGAVVAPDERRVHRRSTPTLGGVAMFVAFLIAMLVAWNLPGLAVVFHHSSEPAGVVLGAAVIVVVGLIDDLKEISAPAKVAGQVLAATVLYYLGVTMFQFKIPFAGFVLLSPGLIPLVTAIWVVGIANAINLIDGLDGLAAGIVAIASGALFIYGTRLVNLDVLSPHNVGPLLAIIAFGVCIGFLPHNFNPARIFMGDVGSMFLGIMMASGTMVIGGRTPDVTGETYFFFEPLLICFFILGVPILDMVLAIIRRTARRSGVSTPDKDHLHHRLVRLGHGPRRAVLILWAWTAVLSGFVLLPTFDPQGNAYIIPGAAALVVLLITLFRPGQSQKAGMEPISDNLEGANLGINDERGSRGRHDISLGSEEGLADREELAKGLNGRRKHARHFRQRNQLTIGR